MSVQELRAESQRRGLGTARARADLIQRLTDDDAASDTPAEDGPADEAVPLPELASSPAGPRAFRQDFAAEAGGPDEETHLAYREATVQAAIEAGHLPRGDARLTATVDGRWVYEVSVRQVT